MKKLDESKARWIIAQKRKGMTNARIAETMCISVRWVKKISARYSNIDADKIVYPMPMGRPRDSLPGRREHSAVLTARRENHVGAVRLHRRIEESTGMNIPYNRIHRILRDEDLASEQPKNSNPRCAIWHLMQTDQWGRAQTILMYDQKDRLRRDMMNNGKIYESVEKMLRESIVPSAEVSKRYNATYGASDFNAGMLHAAMLDTSVGGCSLVMREITAQSIENPRYSRHSPSDEWFRNILFKTDEGKALGTFNQAVRAQLDEICLLGRLPDVLDVAIDMRLIPCHSKRLGSDLRGGERKSGTNRFEAYITAQCVNSKSRLILAALYMDKSSSVHESLRKTINLCLENVSAVGSRLGLILVDRGFFSVNSISEIERLSLEYLMPCTRTSRVKDSLRKFVAKTLGPISKSDMTNSDRATVQYHMIITKKRRVRKESEKAKNGSKKAKKADAPEDRYITFATNAPWVDVEEYSKRWTIETCYRLVGNARAKSFGSSRPARLFCFLYLLTLFNAWVLVNAQLASFLKLRGGVLPVTQLYMKIATLIAIYRNITIQPEPPPDPVAP